MRAKGVRINAAPTGVGPSRALIVFEGMDRAGKTTQAKLLQQRFIEMGREVRFMRFPGTFCLSVVSYRV